MKTPPFKYPLRYRLTAVFVIAAAMFLRGIVQAETIAPLTLQAVVRIALDQRQEITAARARADAARERPNIVSALEDPMIFPAIEHYPFEQMNDSSSMDVVPDMEESEAPSEPAAIEDSRNGRYDWSVSVEQKFPLSRVLTHRRHAADADAVKASADADTLALNIELEAVTAFYMLHEKRSMGNIIDQQLALTHQLVDAAAARYSAGQSDQSDVLRVEVEVARVESAQRALQAEIRAATHMLNASLGRAPDLPAPALISPSLDLPLPAIDSIKIAALQQRPELQAGAAEVARADADNKVMRAMYAPMGMVRVGYASTMAEGKGAMLMLGVSLPIWREKLHSGVAEARAMQHMARADLEAMKRMVEAETLAAWEQLDAARIQYVALRDNVLPRAQRVVSPTLSAYASGRGNLQAVIEARQALWDLQQEYVMAESTLGLAWARLHRMTGTTKEKSL